MESATLQYLGLRVEVVAFRASGLGFRGALNPEP